MPSEACPHEAVVLAAHRSGHGDADLLEHLRRCPICTEISQVSSSIRNLGSLPNAPALPDPDRLWVRAQISAREDAAARALRMWMLRQTLRYGLPGAGAVWLFLDWTKTDRPGLDVWVQSIAWPFADPVANIAISGLVALGTAFVAGGLFIGRRLVARRLKYLGLL